MQRQEAGEWRTEDIHRFSVEILGLATAVPGNTLLQSDALARAKRHYPQIRQINDLFANAGVSKRYTVEPSDWYEEEHSWEERTESFQRNALALLEDVALRAATDANIAICDVDVLITNTVTGLSIPSLDARLMNRLDFRPDVERLPIFGFGCGGGVAGLARANAISQVRAGQTVMFLTIDLCSLCMRVNDPSVAMVVSGALFGDGAAGVILRSHDGAPQTTPKLAPGRIVATGDHFWPGTEYIMGWDIKNDGFGVVLSPKLPILMRERLSGALDAFLERHGVCLQDFDGFLFHPGGAKVLTTLQALLNLDENDLRHSWAILRDYGNMSSSTALFILHRAIGHGARGRHLLAAFGPGFSAYFAILDL